MQAIMESAKKENLLLLSSAFLKKQLFISFPELKDLTIEKKFPRTLVLHPTTDEIIFKWIYSTAQDTENKYFGYISQKGLYFKHGPDTIFTIFEKDIRPNYIQPVTQLLSPEEIQNIQLSKSFLQEVVQRKITKMDYLRDAQEIHFIDDQEVHYWIFLKRDGIKQIEKLQKALQQRNLFKTPLQYIDLRISRKVIYKPK